jgi:predicted PurR-regulated permease PerM
METRPSPTERRTFGVLFAIAGVLFLWTIAPVWVPILLGLMVAVVAYPLQKRLTLRYPRHPRLLAGSIAAATVAIGTGLVCFFGFVVVRELLRFLSDNAQDYAMEGEHWLRSRYVRGLIGRIGVTPDQVFSTMTNAAGSLSTHLTSILGSLVSVTSNGVITLLFTAITTYYLLLEGKGLATFIVRLLPLPPAQTKTLMTEFRGAVVAILLGVGVVSLFQGVAAGLGFWLVGVPKPLVWATLTGVTALLPAVGTALTCVPISIVLMVSGHFWAGLGLFIYWGAIVVCFADYFLRPFIMKGHMHMHSMLVLLSIFGGLEAFGPLGLALGPLFCALFTTLVRIYDRNYRTPASPTPTGTGTGSYIATT